MKQAYNITKENRRVRLLAVGLLLALTLVGTVCMWHTNSHAKEYYEGFTSKSITKTVKKRILGKSYRKNRTIGLRDLRYLTMRYIDYKGREQVGEMIVNRKIAKSTIEIFHALYEMKYPIQRMKLVDAYDASDDRSMEANNTSAFNYRVIKGTSILSNHAKGLAIDINPRINPSVGGAQGIVPANGKVYATRKIAKCKGKHADNMIHKNDAVYQLFIQHGFTWGGDWKKPKDYQHFEYIK